MARKRVKRYDDGGEILVQGRRLDRPEDMGFDLARVTGMRTPMGGGFAAGEGSGSGAPGTRFVSAGLPSPANNVRFGKTRTPIGNLYGANVDLSDRLSLTAGLGKGMMGSDAKPKFGVNARLGFKKGGAVKAKPKAKSSGASKRGDGIAQRGKTKGRMV